MDLYERFQQEVVKTRTRPGRQTEYLIGVKHKMLTVIDFRYSKKSGITWICLCECGKKAYTRTRKNLEKRIGCQSCTASLKSAIRNHDISHYGYYKRKYKEYKDGAKKRHIDFLISEEEAFKLMKGDCSYCGSPPEIKDSKYKVKTEQEPLIFNGIDRVDSNSGYTIDNCVSCCTYCNYGKHSKTKQEFLEWIKRVYIHNFEK